MKTAVEVDPFWLFQCFTLTEALERHLMRQQRPMAALYSPFLPGPQSPTLRHPPPPRLL